MNEASCGSCLTTASASLRMRAQIGSTLSIGVILCGWAIAVLRRRGFSLLEFSTNREPSAAAPPPDGAPSLPWDRGRPARFFGASNKGGRDARGPRGEGGGVTAAPQETPAPPPWKPR